LKQHKKAPGRKTLMMSKTKGRKKSRNICHKRNSCSSHEEVETQTKYAIKV